ncbi:acyl-CoA N-acyltransferase [Thelephora ganbajun]|uniref:Acyl-CoA N-acyltransferase n=1 Tax=Thelephora ganbajun TaxID=370292 RepID=A0ACB6ZGE6_THEGA|nr:acyl-CoA N-acyltransferase [Thelephora ganbajun]
MTASATFTETHLPVFVVKKNGVDQLAHVIEGDESGHAYVHYLNTDKRLDEWISEELIRPAAEHEARTTIMGPSSSTTNGIQTRKRKRGSDAAQPSPTTRRVSGAVNTQPGTPREEGIPNGAGAQPTLPRELTEEEYDIQQHRKLFSKRNFDKVVFGQWQIKTWYFSPYPVTESESNDTASSSVPRDPSTPAGPNQKVLGVARTSIRAHGRTSDLLAGGLNRSHARLEQSVLWVCDRCFNYMTDGTLWEVHVKKCGRKHPPGKKVYQRGAHTIWEVDGAKDKLYCQNLSLFGKLFIDIKTLFFDTDNFLFYLLTDADSQRDHVLGFFSKEKISYDDYNLACIVVLPPYQRKGYGMLMIEFSYELCRRAGKVGTPERPLSDLGLRSYLAYWVATIIRFLRRLLSVLPPSLAQTEGNAFDVARISASTKEVPVSPMEPSVVSPGPKRKRRKSVKGWDGEIDIDLDLPTAPDSVMDDPLFKTLRTFTTTQNPDGSATTHVIVRCTLADLARATNLRIEDAAFAMNECGLLRMRGKNGREADAPDMIVVTREMVEQVAKERGVKKACLILPHVLL